MRIAVSRTLLAERCAAMTPEAFARRDGFRSHGEQRRRFGFEFHSEPVNAFLSYRRDASLWLEAGGAQDVLVIAELPAARPCASNSLAPSHASSPRAARAVSSSKTASRMPVKRRPKAAA